MINDVVKELRLWSSNGVFEIEFDTIGNQGGLDMWLYHSIDRGSTCKEQLEIATEFLMVV